MTVNQYTQPTNVDFINTYVPIDFGALYNIAQNQQRQVQEASQQFNQAVQQLGSFQSPSGVDMKRYYDLTLGRKDISSEINKMSTDPDYLKDSANRSRFQSMLNTIDYGELSRLKQSAAQAVQLQKNIDKLKSEGKFNPQWFVDAQGRPIDISTWDTSKQGILKADTPIAYMTQKELSDPYFKNLGQGLIGHKVVDGIRYNVIGNRPEDLLNVAKLNVDEIMKTPQGQMYYNQALIQADGNVQKARDIMINDIAASQIDRTLRPKMEFDEGWFKMRTRADKLAKDRREEEQKLDTVSQQLGYTSNFKIISDHGGLTTQETNDLFQGKLPQEKQQQVAGNIQNSMRNLFANNLSTLSGIKTPIYKNAIDAVGNSMTSDISEDTNKILMNEGSGIQSGNIRIQTDTGNMLLARDKFFNMMGYGDTNTFLRAYTGDKAKPITKKGMAANEKFKRMWYNNQFRDVIVQGENGTVTDLNNIYHRRRVYIPMSELRIAGFSLEDAALIGKLTRKGKVSDIQEVVTKYKIDDSGEIKDTPETKFNRSKKDDTELYLEVQTLYGLDMNPKSEIFKTRNALYEKKVRGLGSKDRYSQALDE